MTSLSSSKIRVKQLRDICLGDAFAGVNNFNPSQFSSAPYFAVPGNTCLKSKFGSFFALHRLICIGDNVTNHMPKGNLKDVAEDKPTAKSKSHLNLVRISNTRWRMSFYNVHL